MKATIPKAKLIITTIVMSAFSILLCSNANAFSRSFNYWEENELTPITCQYKQCSYSHRYGYYCQPMRPALVAACTTSQTVQPLPTYVCCGLKGSDGWKNTWVSGTCQAANAAARENYGCTYDSPVYGTGAPILQRGQCQFSAYVR